MANLDRRSVLMIAKAFYPSNVSGAHRPVAFAKYLPEYGWTPTVLSAETPVESLTFDRSLCDRADPENIHRVPVTAGNIVGTLRKIHFKLLGGGKVDYRLDDQLYRDMKSLSLDLFRRKRFDAIWSTFSPGMTHRLASELSRCYEVPWIADFRDLPCQEGLNRAARFAIRQEQAYCSDAQALTVTTQALAHRLEARHRAPVHIIENGYDPSDYRDVTADPPSQDVFEINYFGWLYAYRNPRAFFAALDELLTQGDSIPVRVTFYGCDPTMVTQFAEPFRCSTLVNAGGRLNYRDMIRRQLESHLLLMISPPQQGGAIPAKLYSYLASRRPILNVSDDRAVTEVIERSNAGFSSTSPREIADFLKRSIGTWQREGHLACNHAGDFPQHARQTHAGQLAHLLDRCCGKQSKSR